MYESMIQASSGMAPCRCYKASSRHGCLECNGQKIKSGSLSRDPACECRSSSSLAWTKARSRSSTPIHSSTRMSPSVADSALTAQYQNIMEHSIANSQDTQLNIEDLELMMQWCTTTYRSVSCNRSVEDIWQAVVPREAMCHTFLMHGILALSALHLAVVSDGDVRERYLVTSQAHQNEAVLGLAKLAGNLKPNHCNAAFTTSNLMMIFSFAWPEITAKGHQSPIDELYEAFQSTRRSTDALSTVTELLGNGELKSLFECDKSQPKMPDTSRLAIMSLAASNVNLARQNPHHDKDLYDITIRHLGSSLDKVSRGGETMIVAFQWILQVPEKYIELYHQREPFALVLLAYYAVILHSLRRHWWMGDWGVRLIQEVGQNLDTNWRNSIMWVLDATGCYIPPA
ncbi:hypothetical protein BDV18DRAFT_146627 [Aspergillus unguis]